MKNIKTISLILISLITLNCESKNSKKNLENTQELPNVLESKITKEDQNLDQYATAYFAAGCFWCVEAIFESVKGVHEVVSGYSGGTQSNPNYEKVSSGTTDYAEAVKIYYDPKVISFRDLVIIFFGSHDPTTLNQQGPDIGTQYRSIAFYKNDAEKEMIQKYIDTLEKEHSFKNKITTEIKKFTKFYPAEDYHQNYESLHPNNSYIQNVSVPRINRFKNKFSNYLK
ncbi:peptide-methionine (S)-S-oxide reductase MsrA [Flavobacterium sp. J27]|uniref:peptide-methionine (S)-S-oxide reductase MsrA n=1 Tax=Flavobacterium sp. J27 TaxID=2060419 RepID=UPI001030C296|nr:peptide-methionine (S)-S-oxide reductase MsrA [Flavobacterium sp. J27]